MKVRIKGVYAAQRTLACGRRVTIGLFQVATFTSDHMDLITSKYKETPTRAKAIWRTVSAVLG